MSTVEDKENRIPGLNFGDDIKVGTFIDSGATLTIDGKGTVWEDKIGRTLLSGVGKNNDGTLNITNGAKFITKDLHLGLDTFKIIKDPVYYTEEEFGGHYTNMIKEKGIIEYVPAMSRAIINVEGENSTLKADNIESIIVKKNGDTTRYDSIAKYKDYEFVNPTSSIISNRQGTYVLNLKDGGTLEIGKKVDLGTLVAATFQKATAEFNSDGGIVRFTHSTPANEFGNLTFNKPTIDLGFQISLGEKGIVFDTNGNNVDLKNTMFVQSSYTHKNTKFTKVGKGILRTQMFKDMSNTNFKSDIEVDEGVLQVGTIGLSPTETLTIGVRSKDDYGKIEATNFNIGDAKLFVNSDKATLSNGNILKDVIIADVARGFGVFGKFSEIKDNNNYVDFEENLEDRKGVDQRRSNLNLKVVASTAPNPDKPNPDKPNPDKPNPDKPGDNHNQNNYKDKGTDPLTQVKKIVGNNNVNVGLAGVLTEVLHEAFPKQGEAKPSKLGSEIATKLGTLSDKKAVSAIEELAPLLHSSSAKVKANTLRSVSSMIDSRNTDLEVIKDKDLDRTFWMKAYGMFDELDKSKNGAMGYKGDHYGAILGFDSFVSDNLNLGLALAYTKSDIDSKGNAKHNLKSDIVQVYGYGDLYLNNNLKLDFKAGVGFADNDGKRTFSFANKTAKSSYDSNIYMAGLGLGYDINLSNLQITPFLRADYIYVKDDGYTETGADMFNLKVNSNDYDSLLLRLGVKGSYKVADKFGLFGDVSLGVETLDTDSEVKSKFKSTKSFVTKYESDDNIYGQLSLGAFYKPTISSEISLNYGLEKSKDYDSHKAMLGFKYSF